ANLHRRVIVVDVQPPRLRRATADSAAATLRGQHRAVVVVRDGGDEGAVTVHCRSLSHQRISTTRTSYTCSLSRIASERSLRASVSGHLSPRGRSWSSSTSSALKPTRIRGFTAA